MDNIEELWNECSPDQQSALIRLINAGGYRSLRDHGSWSVLKDLQKSMLIMIEDESAFPKIELTSLGKLVVKHGRDV